MREKMARQQLVQSPPPPRDWVRGKAVGSGSFGVVNLAMNKSTGELFVVKSASPGARLQSLKSEFDILRSLNSPYIVQCLGHELSEDSDGEKFNLFMEYMAGGSLSEIVEKFGGSLNESVICSYTKEILNGIHYLHRNGIIHGDLKCKNVLVGSSGNVKLADFGCARQLGACRKKKKPPLQSICGTPLWMAPEVLRNEGLVFASDIWSLGCTVIEMATGKPPWGEEINNPMAAVFKITCGDERPRIPANFSGQGIGFLEKCLERDPLLRWSSEELLNHPFINPTKREEGSGSPTSILDGGNWISEELEPPQDCEGITGGMIPSPFSSRFGCMGDNSDAWLTVRSGEVDIYT